MLDFMDYIQLAFAETTNWNRDNSYTSLTSTAQSLLDFSVPERFRIHLSSLSTPHFATSYTLGTVGLLDGSVSYLFTTVPLGDTPSNSGVIPLRKICPGYRQVHAPIAPAAPSWRWDSWLDGLTRPNKAVTGSDTTVTTAGVSSENAHDAAFRDKATLLHATLHLPPPTTLNALFLRRISSTMQATLAVCSTRGPPLSKSAPQASLLAQLSHDTGKYSNEYLVSTDNTLFGWRGLWNFGPDPRTRDANAPPRVSLLSAGAEAYYSPASSLIGMSTGLRFSTLPAATEVASSSPISSTRSSALLSTSPASQNVAGGGTGPISTFPYTLTLTLTPLTGSLSTTYSVRASPNLAFSSRFGFNVYSWESEMVAGCELWRRSRKTRTGNALANDNNVGDVDDGLEWARRKMRENPWSSTTNPVQSEVASGRASSSSTSPSAGVFATKINKDQLGDSESVVKIRVDQSWNVRLLWEGRVQSLVVSAGVALGPGSFTPSSSSGAGVSSADSSSGQSAGGGGVGSTGFPSYWRGVGVSVSYSS